MKQKSKSNESPTGSPTGRNGRMVKSLVALQNIPIHRSVLSSADYSPKELLLISHFGFSDIAASTNPTTLYYLMAEKVFMDNDQSRYADSLRRCLRAFEKGGPYRMTPEWDDLIDLIDLIELPTPTPTPVFGQEDRAVSDMTWDDGVTI